MNTGIGDAVNLAWKLADTLRGRARPEAGLLPSYQQERVKFARRLVATTDRAFTLVSRNGWLARNVRLRLLPRLLPGVMRRQAARRFAFRVLSQTAVSYRGTALSRGRAGHVRGGDRLPWLNGLDNDRTLTSLDWQIHVYGEATAPQRRLAERWHTPLQVFPWSKAGRRAGLKRGAAYLVRPDGYVAVADAGAGALRIDGYLQSLR